MQWLNLSPYYKPTNQNTRTVILLNCLDEEEATEAFQLLSASVEVEGMSRTYIILDKEADPVEVFEFMWDTMNSDMNVVMVSGFQSAEVIDTIIYLAETVGRAPTWLNLMSGIQDKEIVGDKAEFFTIKRLGQDVEKYVNSKLEYLC